MKFLILIATLFSATAFAADRPSTHGMALIGNQKIYVSHLPMFHSPHDYQVIMEVEMDAKTRGIYNSNFVRFRETYYTIAPEKGVLPDMAKPGVVIKADLFRGHFERGGTLIAEGVPLAVKQVLYFKKFVPGDQKPATEKSVVFGNAKEQFAAHIITSKPDFDRLSRVDASSKELEDRTVTVESADLKVIKELYFETGDLEM